MAVVKIYQDHRRIKKDGTFPIVIRVRHEKSYFDIKTPYSGNKNQFDEKNQKFIGDLEASMHLEEIKEYYSKKLREFLRLNMDNVPAFSDIKNYLLNKTADEITLSEFWVQVINELSQAGRSGSARNYKMTLDVIKKIIDCNIPLKKLVYKDIMYIETSLLQRGLKMNAIGVYMRTFRAVCNRAINYDMVPHSWYPFQKYKIKKEKTTPKVLSIEELKKYFILDIDKSSNLYTAWNIGKLIFMLRGINLADLVQLKVHNIGYDSISIQRLSYIRSKTGKKYNILLLPYIENILSCFNSDDNSLLGLYNPSLYSTSNGLQQYYDIRKRINKNLKKIGYMIGTKIPLTTYVFRYSYANIAKQLGFSKDLIAEALGHEYGNATTGIYLENFEQDYLDKMNEVIVNKVLGMY